MSYRNPAIIDHGGYRSMCGYQPTCYCRYNKNLDTCPDYCEFLPRQPRKPVTEAEMAEYWKNKIREDKILLGQMTFEDFE